MPPAAPLIRGRKTLKTKQRAAGKHLSFIHTVPKTLTVCVPCLRFLFDVQLSQLERAVFGHERGGRRHRSKIQHDQEPSVGSRECFRIYVKVFRL